MPARRYALETRFNQISTFLESNSGNSGLRLDTFMPWRASVRARTVSSPIVVVEAGIAELSSVASAKESASSAEELTEFEAPDVAKNDLPGLTGDGERDRRKFALTPARLGPGGSRRPWDLVFGRGGLLIDEAEV